MVAPGLVTFGLGGNATNMILGRFHLGYAEFKVIVKPTKPPRGGKGGGGYGAGTAPTKLPSKHDQYDIIFIVSYKQKRWTNAFIVKPETLNRVLAVFATFKKYTPKPSLVRFKISLKRININEMYIKIKDFKINTLNVALKGYKKWF